jgi:NAD(P)H dehydrogenase (quinone)
MKHAVILAHPAADSLNAMIARTDLEALRSLGQEVLERDLYALGFDPCLKAEEIPGPDAPRFGKDVVSERALLADVDVFAFVYPLWFNAPPAILKGYVDRVFSMGFGFESTFGGTAPKLGGKRLISFTTSGAPDFWVRDTGALDTLRRLFDDHLAGVCGFTVLDHVNFGGMVSGLRQDVFDEVIEHTRATARRHFG